MVAHRAGMPVQRAGLRYQAVAASQSNVALGTAGGIGDILTRMVITVTTAGTAAVSIKDGSGSSISILPNSPGGGVGVYEVPVRLASVSGAWSVTTGAGSTVVAVGQFS